MASFRGVLLAALLLAGVAATATFDKALTSSARAGVLESKVFFTFQSIAPPRRATTASTAKQTLLSLAFPGHSRFGVVLDRVNGKVILETIVSGETRLKEVSAPQVKPRSRLRSLVVELDQEASLANLYLQCKLIGSVELPASPREMSDDIQGLRVYRDRHQDVSIDWDTDVLHLLEKLGCSDGEDTGSVQAQGNEVYTYRRAVRCENLQFGEPCPIFTQPVTPSYRGGRPHSQRSGAAYGAVWSAPFPPRERATPRGQHSGGSAPLPGGRSQGSRESLGRFFGARFPPASERLRAPPATQRSGSTAGDNQEVVGAKELFVEPYKSGQLGWEARSRFPPWSRDASGRARKPTEDSGRAQYIEMSKEHNSVLQRW